MGSNIVVCCREPLGSNHKIWAHGARQCDQNLQISLFLNARDLFFGGIIQCLPGASRIVKSQHKRGKLVTAGDPMKSEARWCAIGQTYFHAGSKAFFSLFINHFHDLSVFQPATPPTNKKKKNRKKKNKTKVTHERNDIPEFKQKKDILQNEPLSHQEIAQPKANESSPPQKINPTNDPDCAESTTKSAIMADT